MATTDGLWQSDGKRRKGAAAGAIKALEASAGVKLPAAFARLYGVRNGGSLRDVGEPAQLLPIRDDGEPQDRVSSLADWLADGPYRADDLDGFLDEWETAPARILIFAYDGHVAFALDYGARGNRPAVIRIDFEIGDVERVASTFPAWIKGLTDAKRTCGVDWSEHETLEELHRAVIAVGAEETEQVLCAAGEGALVFFERTEGPSGVTRVERASLPKGVDGRQFELARARHHYLLFLQPRDGDDIEWVSTERKSNGKWRTERDVGVPTHCKIAGEEEQLIELEQRLREGGFVPNSKRRSRAKRSGPAVRTEPPERGPAPESMKPEDAIREINDIQLYLAHALEAVDSLASARALLEAYGTHRERCVALARRLDFFGDPLRVQRTEAPLELLEKALRGVKGRSPEAHGIVKELPVDVVMEAIRPEQVEAAHDALVQDLLAASEDLTAGLRDVMALDGDVDDEALHAAVQAWCTQRDRVDDLRETDSRRVAKYIEGVIERAEAFLALEQAWNELQTRHRKLAKTKKPLLKGLPEIMHV